MNGHILVLTQLMGVYKNMERSPEILLVECRKLFTAELGYTEWIFVKLGFTKFVFLFLK